MGPLTQAKERLDMDPNKAARLVEQANTVHGWFSREAAMLFALLDEVQQENAVTGPLFEIGVHHGKSACLIGAMAAPGREHLGVCDVFGGQESNASGSGSGDRDVFERNMRRLVPGTLDVRVFGKLSSALRAGEIGTGYRWFHIDGGHNPNEALGDLRLAAEVLGETGLIVVDDPFRPEWPGVTEALIRFLDQDTRFAPVVVGFNKLVLAHRLHSALYCAAIDDRARRAAYGIGPPWLLKELPFLRDSLRILYLPSHYRPPPDGLLARIAKVFRP
jgi:hypothetical protein